MAEGPVGELEELIGRALIDIVGNGQVTIEEATPLVAARLAPHVVLREQLEHVGWIDADRFTTERESDDARAVFCIPARVVNGSGHIAVIWGAGTAG